MSIEHQKTCDWHESPQRDLQFFSLESIFAKPKAYRTQKDIDFIVNRFKRLSFFSSLQKDEQDLDELLVELVSVMNSENFKEGDTVFHYGDRASKFYIIINGSADIYVPKSEEEFKRDILELQNLYRKKTKFQRKNLIRKTEIKHLTKKGEEESTSLERNQSEYLLTNLKSQYNLIDLDNLPINQEEITFKFKKVNTITSGAYFGEVALYLNCARNATVMASSNLFVATISREDYHRKLCHFEQKFDEKVTFFKELLHAEADQERMVAKFCYTFKERKYIYDQKIFIQGEMPQEVFIVKHGEVQISTHKYQDKLTMLGQSPLLKTPRMLNQKLANLEPYNLFGENEALDSKPYSTSAISVSNNTVLYVISVKDFKDLKANYRSLFKRILTIQDSKSSYFADRIENLHSITKQENRAAKILTRQEIIQFHDPTFIEARFRQMSLPKLQESHTPRKATDSSPVFSPNSHDEPMISLFSDCKLGAPLSPRNNNKLLTKIKLESMSTSTEPTPKSSKREYTFGDYCDTIQSEDKLSEVKESKPPKFILKLKKRSLKGKKTKTDPLFLLIRSDSQFMSARNITSKNIIKRSDHVEKKEEINTFLNIDSCDEQIEIGQKIRKRRCSIINHLK